MLPELITSSLACSCCWPSGRRGPTGHGTRHTCNELSDARPAGEPIGLRSRPIAFDRVATDSRTAATGRPVLGAARANTTTDTTSSPMRHGRGAVACVVEEDQAIPAGVPALVVPDILQGLQDFARLVSPAHGRAGVGVTGTVGKTTTREMMLFGAQPALRRLPQPEEFQQSHRLAALRARHRATPRVRRARNGCVATSARFANWPKSLDPEVGVLTSVGIAHLEGFGSIETIAADQGRTARVAARGGFAVINGDDPRCRESGTPARCRVIDGRQKGRKHVSRDRRSKRPATSSGFAVDGDNLRGSGRRTASPDRPALAAVAVAREVGTSSRANCRRPVAVRAGRRSLPGPRAAATVDTDRRHVQRQSRARLEAACRLLARLERRAGRRILVLADMAELGDRVGRLARTRRTHGGRAAESIGLAAVGRYAADVLARRSQPGNAIRTAGRMRRSRRRSLAVLDCWIEPGDVVLVKGSRSMQMERVDRTAHLSHRTFRRTSAPCTSTRACA